MQYNNKFIKLLLLQKLRHEIYGRFLLTELILDDDQKIRLDISLGDLINRKELRNR